MKPQLKPQSVFHSSLEAAQHGPKTLSQLLHFAKNAGAAGVQPSNFHLSSPKGKGFISATQFKKLFTDSGLMRSGISAHCPFWVHTTAWTRSKTIRPFISDEVAQMSPEKITQWAEDYILRFLDFCAEVGVKIVPMFWGVAFGWEVGTGYPWGLWSHDKGSGAYDLIKEGEERFVKMTQKIRDRARQLGIFLCHEIHPGTAAMCADDFLMLRKITDDDSVVAVNIDQSHCWEGEPWQTRLDKVGPYVYAAHIKDHRVQAGLPLRRAVPNWPQRAMQFVPLGTGDLNMHEYADRLIAAGYARRYCEVTGASSAPLVVEAESPARDLDWTSAAGIKYVNNNLVFPAATGSFEDGMGEQGSKKKKVKSPVKKK